MRIRFYLLCFLAIVVINSNAQGLHAGTQWPADLEFRSVLNYPESSVRLSAFAGKPLLIHMWTFSCKGCIAEFPKLDSLQQQFGDSLQILMINPESPGAVDSFFRKFKKVHRPHSTPMLTGEVDLHNRLRMLGDLWLDSSHTVRYAASVEHASADNLRRFITGKPLTFKPNVFIEDYDNSKPLIAEGNGRWVDSVVSYSYFFHHAFQIDLLNPVGPLERKPATRLLIPGTQVITLYNRAYQKDRQHPFTDVTIDIPDSLRSLFFAPTGEDVDENWRINHKYTYEIKVPDNKAHLIWDYMREDLSRQFDLTARVEMQYRDCWVLAAQEPQKFASNNGERFATGEHPLMMDTATILQFRHYPFTRILSNFESFVRAASPLPFVNEVKYKAAVNFSIPIEVIEAKDIRALQKVFKLHGFNLKSGKRKVPVLVIRKKSSNI